MPNPERDKDRGGDAEPTLPRPFPDRFAHRSCEVLAEDQRTARVQIAGMTRRARDASTRRLLLASLRERRERRGWRRWRRWKGLTQFDSIAAGHGIDVLFTRGELLVRRDVLERDRGLRRFFEHNGFRPQRITELRGLVVRQVHPRIRGQRLSDIARFLRDQGVEVSVNHIPPLGPIGKGLGGAEPTRARLEFPQPREGARLPVAIIDTGITAERRTDDWLESIQRTAGNIDRLDVLPPGGDGFLDLFAGHGTFAAGVIQQVEPGADIRMYKALDGDGLGDDVEIAIAIVRAVKEGARVLNLSLGTQTVHDEPPIAMQVALEIIDREGGEEVVVVAAAGNFGTDAPCFPAAFRRVVAVGALTPDGRGAEWSNRGFWVQLSTIGEGIISTYVEGTEPLEVDFRPDTFGPNSFALWSGSSFAAPQVVGAIARLHREKGISPRQAVAELQRQGVPVPDFGRGLEILPGT
jgi:Subtilase family